MNSTEFNIGAKEMRERFVPIVRYLKCSVLVIDSVFVSQVLLGVRCFLSFP